ncbi:MAG: hypothetical protein IKR51_00470 [Oscillospiraceae bacterium]|nr:hypothetical protein [Oscillospiraceae bacterium]
MNARAAYFLGANTCSGFCSVFEDFASEETTEKLYVIKGGPGCGKSGFMRSVASALLDNGLDVEFFPCSGDPDSLDGIYIPELKTAYLDGTAPHVIEPMSAGVTGNYVSFAQFYDGAISGGERERILGLTRGYKAAYAEAYRALKAYGALRGEQELPSEAADAARERVRRLTRQLLGKRRGGRPRIKTRFLDAFTHKGRIFLTDTLAGGCEEIILLDNSLGLAHEALEACASEAQRLGAGIVRCPDALFPDKLLGGLVPSACCAFIAADKRLARALRGRHVRLDAIAARYGMKPFSSEAGDVLLREAQESLSRAKSLHDALEQAVNPHVDFGGVYALAEAHAKALLSGEKML